MASLYSCWVLSSCSMAFFVPLTLIIVRSLSIGDDTELWRMANVCSIFKKGSKLWDSNYRPMSLDLIFFWFRFISSKTILIKSIGEMTLYLFYLKRQRANERVFVAIRKDFEQLSRQNVTNAAYVLTISPIEFFHNGVASKRIYSKHTASILSWID